MLWKHVMKKNLFPEKAAQGYFRYFKADGTTEDIMAIEGKLYKAEAEIPITGLASFQTTRQVEAVQFKDKLYIATGTKLVVYDGTEAKVIVPYKPESLEVLYIGTNALADNPDQYITDSTSAFIQVTGVTTSMRYGVVNKENTFTAYVAKPAVGNAEFKWEKRVFGADTWTLINDFSTAKKQVKLTLPLGDHEIRCVARMVGETNDVFYAEYWVPKYSVKETDQNKQEDVSMIHQCNRILLHWNRIVLYGDPKQKDMIYLSDLDRPDYFPSLNTLRFENTEQEGLTAIVKFREMLVAFTPHSIQGLTGKGPEEFTRMLLSSSVGCIAPYSARVMENYVAFLSLEGVHILKSIGFSENRVNVQKIDSKIDNIMPRDTDACAVVANGQYQITFPSRNIRFRCYYHDGVWTKDESPKLDFNRLYESNGVIIGQSATTSKLLRSDPSVFSDDGYTYTDKYTFKDYDFGEPYNPKKLKEMQILLGQISRTDIAVYVYADGAEIISPDRSYASVNEFGEVVWNEKSVPNITIDAGTTLGSWVMGGSSFGNVESAIQKIMLSGKCRRVRVEIVHEDSKPNVILGIGFIFKSRKP
jgi:hypothetical protein